MRRILEAFTATSIPTGSFMLLMGLGSLGVAPGLDAVQVEEPEALWATLTLPPPMSLELELDTPDSPAPEVSEPAQSATPTADTSADTSAPTRRSAKPEGLLRSRETRAEGAEKATPSAAPERRHQEGVAVRHTAPSKGGSCMDPTDAIVQLSNSSWSVERSYLEALAADREAAGRLAVLTWSHSSGGEIDGFKVRRVRCGSPLHQAGFRNGDVIHGVNGHKVTSLAEAVWTYGQVRKSSQLKVNLTRKDGSSARLRYTVK